MRTNRRFLPCMTLFVAVSGISLFAQGKGLRFMRPATGRQNAVTGSPYSAAETVQTSSFDLKVQPPAKSYKIYRDTQGRTVTAPARAPGGYNPALTEVDDPVAGYWYILDSATGTTYRSKLPVWPPKIANPQESSSGVTTVSLGSQFLSGVQTNGTRTTIMSDGATVEEWVSPEMHLVMVLRTTNSGGTGLTQITDLQLGEPAAALFQIPADYAIVDETGPFVLH